MATSADPCIRQAVEGDAAPIARLHVDAWQAAYRGILPDEMLDGLDVAERTRRRRALLARPPSPNIRNWVCEANEELLGWAATGPARDDDLDDSVLELYAIYLQPDVIGRGHGRALMQHCLADAAQRGFVEMTMWVLTGNERAQHFYRAAGFVRDERAPEIDFKGTGAMKRRMRRSL